MPVIEYFISRALALGDIETARQEWIHNMSEDPVQERRHQFDFTLQRDR
jgi:alpha-galactosidase/6-phospho-beta-glucosidase family protein